VRLAGIEPATVGLEGFLSTCSEASTCSFAFTAVPSGFSVCWVERQFVSQVVSRRPGPVHRLNALGRDELRRHHRRHRHRASGPRTARQDPAFLGYLSRAHAASGATRAGVLVDVFERECPDPVPRLSGIRPAIFDRHLESGRPGRTGRCAGGRICCPGCPGAIGRTFPSTSTVLEM
jgi:hypothetical protein